MSLTPERFARIKALLLEAQPLAASEREAFLRRRAVDDPALVGEVLSLLAQENSAHSLLDEGVVPPPAPAEHPARIGPYQILEVLGEGGMGVVYRARQTQPIEREVALKLIRGGHHSESLVRRFEQERRSLARMDHPNIATVLDAGSDERGRPWLAMPLVDGQPLLAFCDEEKLSVDARLELFIDICRAVHHAHGRGVLHRDLKPGNILVRRVEQRIVPTIIDFGIAKALQEDVDEDSTLLTRDGQRIGTPAYMSPEQIAGNEATIDARSDVFALGVILYELLTGQHPYGGAEPGGTHATTGTPRSPSTALDPGDTAELAARRGVSSRELRRRLRGDIDTICLMAVRPEPDRRYASAAHLADDLRRYLSGHPVLARPDSWTYRFGKLVRRHPARSSAALAMVILVVAGGIGLAWHARSVELERDRAIAAEARAQRELETSTAIGDFMEGLFVLAQPGQGGPAAMSARELLEQGSDRVRDELAGQPWLQARVYRVLANLHHTTSQHAVAESLVVEALRLNTAAIDRGEGERAQQAGSIHLLHSIILHDLGRYAEAEASDRLALAAYQNSGRADSTDIAAALNNLGVDLQVQGKLQESVAPTQRALRLHEAYGPGEDPEVAWGWGSLGYIHYQLGDLARAEEEFLHALELAREIFDGDHYDLAHHLNNLGGLYRELHRLDEAEVYIRENLAMNQRIFVDEPHGSLARAYLAMGGLLQARGRHEEALAHFEQGYRISVASLGEEHARTAAALAVLARGRNFAGQRELALEEMLRAKALREQILPAGHPAYEGASLSLGKLYLDRGEPQLALPLLQRWRKYVESAHPEGHFRRGEAYRLLARAQIEANEPGDATALLEAALHCYSASYGLDHPDAAECAELLTEARRRAH